MPNRRLTAVPGLMATLLLAGAAAAAQPAKPVQPAAAPATAAAPAAEPAKPVTEREPTATDVVATPVTDLGLRKGEIPAILQVAQADPYGLPLGARCPALAAEVRRLDAVLGEDIDIGQARSSKVSAGRVAQSVVGSFIPFRGVIRELSGANEQQRKLQEAVYAGTARRAFLKGVGLQRGCAWPARPATPQMLAQIARENEAKARETAAQPKR